MPSHLFLTRFVDLLMSIIQLCSRYFLFSLLSFTFACNWMTRVKSNVYQWYLDDYSDSLRSTRGGLVAIKIV